jgi:Xaa-Pro dipeptidase
MSKVSTLTKISKNSYEKRIGMIQERLRNQRVSGLFVSNTYNIYYTTGLFHYPTERPIALFVPQQGEPVLFIPIMEQQEARHINVISDIRVYFEYPGLVDPIDWMLGEINKTYPKLSSLALDSGSYRLVQQIREKTDAVVTVSPIIYDMRLIKDEEEVELLKKAGHYSDYIIQAGMEIAVPGITELELLQEMSNRTLNKMVRELDEIILVPGGPTGGLVPSGIRTAMPHALPSAKRLAAGETLILSCGTNVGGYRTECERTCFIEDVGKKQEQAFQVMARAQQMALEAMRPGKTCAEVDAVALDYIRKEGYGDYLLHRTGHGKGLEEHEAPWIDAGDHTILLPGMVLSSEPGIYIEGFSGFRHSDTIVVTDGDPLMLTQFPKSIDQMIIKK